MTFGPNMIALRIELLRRGWVRGYTTLDRTVEIVNAKVGFTLLHGSDPLEVGAERVLDYLGL